MSAAMIPLEYTKPGFEGLLPHIGTDPQGELLSGREAQVVALSVYFRGQVHELIARTAPSSDDGLLYEGDADDLHARAAALYMHVGGRSLEQLVAYNPHIVVTSRVPGSTLDELPANTANNISHSQLDNLATAIIEACQQPFELDASASTNALYDGDAITLIDYSLSSGLGVASREYGRFISRTLRLLMREAATIDVLVAWRDVAYRAMNVMQDRFPEEFVLEQGPLRVAIAEAMQPNGRRKPYLTES